MASAQWLPLAAWRSAALALLFAHAGFVEAASPLRSLRETAAQIAEPGRFAARATGNQRVSDVARWVRMHTEPGEPVLFLPNNAAYYYLADRPAAIRFVMGHQMVTDAHRREVLAALRRDPPRFVVWDDAAVRVDGLADELVFGEEILAWIASGYEEERRLGPVRILRRREPSGPRPRSPRRRPARARSACAARRAARLRGRRPRCRRSAGGRSG
jgi:hypothetical protein